MNTAPILDRPWGRLALLIAALTAGAASSRGTPDTTPAILDADYPRAFFFRIAESEAANPRVGYAEWDAAFSRLLGIEGKALDEELSHAREARNPEIFTRFKREHPRQMVLLHYNGTSQDPDYDPGRYFAGAWLYDGAVEILSDVPAESGETDIRVSDTRSFHLGIGRFHDRNSDLGLFRTKGGVRDWETAEQVELVSIDPGRQVIRVKRALHGTAPQAFPRGSQAAAHLFDGPWGKNAALLWEYNFSTRAPRDRQGRNASDLLAHSLAEKLGPGGKLANFDGVEFDVAVENLGAQSVDMDGDGRVDGGRFGGVNTYGLGLLEFYRELRTLLGPQRLILADATVKTNQRAFGILNGVESEGWPHHPDTTLRGWSGGLNRMLAWSRQAHAPVLNYVNHRFTHPAAATDRERYQPTIAFNFHRLVFAGAVFTDAAICDASLPRPEPGDPLGIGIWDELDQGTEHRLGWLGRPEGPAVHLGVQTPNLLQGIELSAWKRENGFQVLRTKVKPGATELLVTLKGSATARHGYPASYNRLLEVDIDSAHAQPAQAGWEKFTVPMAWLSEEEAESTFYFRQIGDEEITLKFQVEGTEPFAIRDVTAHAAPDAMYRLFTGGLVLANPSLHPVTFDLARISPGRTYRRLHASAHQDVQANDGRREQAQVTLPALDALFLIRTR